MKTASKMVPVLFYLSFVVAILTATDSALAGQILGASVINEAFTGQLVIALIAAAPPTGMMVIALVTLKRGQIKQQQNQAEMKTALDGKLDKLMAAEKGVSKAEGVKEERERVTTEIVKVEVVQAADKPVPIKDVEKDVEKI